MIQSIDYGFYKVDYEYIKFLHSYDDEVYFNSFYKDRTKPFLGIMVGMNGLNYFIPLSSAKEKHRK